MTLRISPYYPHLVDARREVHRRLSDYIFSVFGFLKGTALRLSALIAVSFAFQVLSRRREG